MSTSIALQVGDRSIHAEDLLPLLVRYQMLPQLLRENLIDQAIAALQCTSEETATACQQFYEQHQLTSEIDRQAWLTRHCLNPTQLEELATRQVKIEKFKQMTWGHKLESYFLLRKQQLDKVIYSLIRVQEMGVAQELYFRIAEGEQTFAALAHQYSQGPEAQTGGLVGPVELGTLQPNLAQIIAVSHAGQLWPPIPWGEWTLIVRLEQSIPAQLNPSMRQRLLNELFEAWLQEQISRLNPAPTAS